MSTSPDIAKSGPLENGSHLLNIVSQGPTAENGLVIIINWWVMCS